ncbi:serine hydrolase [Rhodopseudomonas boonkerdii]|uniref:serine hydrolase n=1 Tax=Rhodopseudomonas boonkerdii TaxID=475937 RepID=UPI00322220DB|nr:serine hydrolase [Rhodopseudomonas boonkerdii]
MRLLTFLPLRVLGALVSLILTDLSPAAADNAVDEQIQRIVSTELASKVGDHGGLAVAVHAAGQTQIFTYGFADQATQRQITSDTLFNLASVRKLFEATLVSLGSIRGEFSLDDPASKYVPELTGDYVKRITIGQLATHTSGLLLPTDHPPWPTDSYSLPHFFAALNGWVPKAGEEPGKQRVYTHAGYVLLQLVLERRYGHPIDALVSERILQPLGMTETFLPARGPDHQAVLPPEILARVVQGYDDDGTAIGRPGTQQGYYDFPGTGQMFSSPKDLGIFLAASLDDTVVDPQLRQALKMTQREMFRVSDEFGQAVAWENVRRNGIEVVDKPGGLNNATAYVGLAPRQRMGIVVLANRGEFPYEIARYRVLPELARLRGQ